MLSSLLFVLGQSVAGSEPIAWEPRRAALQLDAVALELESRLVQQLKMDRAPASSGGWSVFRLVTEPDFSYGWPTSPPESVITVYLPDTGDGSVEFTRAHTSIRAANSGWVQIKAHPLTQRPKVLSKPVVVRTESSRRALPRDIAVALQHAAFTFIGRARVPMPEEIELWIHPTTFSLLAWEQGSGERCSSKDLPDTAFERSVVGGVSRSLRAWLSSVSDHDLEELRLAIHRLEEAAK
jgi:hypothetical protein